MQGLALVDYDNICKPPIRSAIEVEVNTHSLLDIVVNTYRAAFPTLRELDVRLYGGWIDETGSPSQLAIWLYETLPALRSRRNGLIVRPTLATTMIEFPNVMLKGTVRLQTRPKRQKMVDGMLGCDALSVASSTVDQVAIVTDDDDLLPAAMSAHTVNPRSMVWMRRRPLGNGLNDRSLAEMGLRIFQIEG